MTSNHSSCPIKRGHLPSRKASDARDWLKTSKTITEVSYNDLLTNYLPAGCKQPRGEFSWTHKQRGLVQNIRLWTYDIELEEWWQDVQQGKEKELYTDFAPLLPLCNTASKRIFDSLVHEPQTVPVFYYGYDKRLSNPFSGSSLAPDIIVVHEKLEVLECILRSPSPQNLEPSHIQSWATVTAVGEAKVDKDAKYQIANYLCNHLQLRPDLHSVIGFSVDIHGCSLFYHDASFIHHSPKEEWAVASGPLHAFVRQLYQGTPRDPSIINLRPMDLQPSWSIKIDDDIFTIASVTPDPGLGQRRFTALARHAKADALWFIKDIYRDNGRCFFEGVLYNKAHGSRILPGLTHADRHDRNDNLFTTTKSGLGPNRSKMRVATQDVGQALSEAQTLGEFLGHVRRLCRYKILHRDISDSNIMIAPKDDKRFYKRCDGGYDKVKYLNQVLTLAEEPRPACLVIDIGNGADLEFQGKDPGALAKITGTPKFIARSVSTGIPLYLTSSNVVPMPRLAGRSLQLYTARDDSEYEEYNRSVDHGFPQDPDGAKFTHQLFHDAESTFWVMAWFLARAAPKVYQKETQWNLEFQRFVNGMESHRPAGNYSDPRWAFFPVPEYWKEILHPELASMAHMLSAMHKYILPEWGYRPELNAEHAHEALMRLLLVEIVRIRDNNADIELATETRTLPPT